LIDESLTHEDFLPWILKNASSPCDKVSTQGFLTLGAYYKNNIDIVLFLTDEENFHNLYQNTHTESNIEKLSAMAWSLFTFTQLAYSPQQTHEGVLASVPQTFSKLLSIL